MHIGIIVGSIREGRVGPSVAEWVRQLATLREDAEFTVVDLAEFDVPLLRSATVPRMANRRYDDAATQAWSDRIDGLDAFVFVTPEYNHGVPGAFKNAVDVLAPEWFGKAVTFVGYGADGAVRAVEQWRVILANLMLHPTRAQVALRFFSDFKDQAFVPLELRAQELQAALDELVALATALRHLPD